MGRVVAAVSSRHLWMVLMCHARLLYESDFPFAKTEYVKIFAERIGGLAVLFSEVERDSLYQGNAKKLLERKKEPAQTPQ